MKVLLVVLASFFLQSQAFAQEGFCRVAKGWLVANAVGWGGSPEELCTALGGGNCRQARTNREAVCYGFGGSNCRSVEGFSPYDACVYMGGSTNCGHAENIGQGLCFGLHGGTFGRNCDYGDNSGQGICFALSSTNCTHAKNVGQGFCYAVHGGSFGGNCSFPETAEQGFCRARSGRNCDRADGVEEIRLLAAQCGW